MNLQDKMTLERRTRLKYQYERLKNGIHEVRISKQKRTIIAAYLIIAAVVRILSGATSGNADPFSALQAGIFRLLFPFYAVAGLLFLLIRLGTPFGAKQVNGHLWRIGLVNHAGESPLLVRKRPDQANPDITVMEFETNGVPRTEWEDKQAKIEAALNVHIIKIVTGMTQNRVLLYTLPGGRGLPQVLPWRDAYLSNADFELVLGESLMGRETVNLAQIPHILLGGSTGSGKSALLKLLMLQCLRKGAEVTIADFKGGVDFSPAWHRRCKIITDAAALLDTLSDIVEELERRITVLRDSGCANIRAYNKIGNLPRLVFACDEVAEVLDKSGLSKEGKELVTKIEGKLSVIARQGRAFGVHLILATQRPDANILTGQIRNNIDCRVCGRADNVLSQIILDCADAADKIPKDAQGLFLKYGGTVFRGYWLDDSTLAEI